MHRFETVVDSFVRGACDDVLLLLAVKNQLVQLPKLRYLLLGVDLGQPETSLPLGFSFASQF